MMYSNVANVKENKVKTNHSSGSHTTLPLKQPQIACSASIVHVQGCILNHNSNSTLGELPSNSQVVRGRGEENTEKALGTSTDSHCDCGSCIFGVHSSGPTVSCREGQNGGCVLYLFKCLLWSVFVCGRK